MARKPLGEGCECVKTHAPKNYVPTDHHIKPESWGGLKGDNLIRICPNAHTAIHRLIDDYVRAGGDPGWDVRRQHSPFVQRLAKSAWDQRPEHPSITSLER